MGKAGMIRTKAELRAYMLAHPEQQLQHNPGIRSRGWWWMRKGSSPSTRYVHGAIARALIDDGSLESIPSGDWRWSSWRLKRKPRKAKA